MAPRLPAQKAPVATLSGATVERIIACRQHVMRAYGQMTVRVLRDELRRAPARTGLCARHRAESLLRRDPAFMNQEQLGELAVLGSRHHALGAALGMRAELREIWQGRQVDAHQALARLAAWCECAERADVPALHAFALHLRAFG